MGGKVSSPFDEAKYKALLEGLEISVLKLSEANQTNLIFRIDADFYKKEFIETQKLLESGLMLGDFTETVELHSNGAFKDVFNALSYDEEKVVPYIRSTNIGNYFIEGELEKISLYAHNILRKTHTQYKDVLMARTGKIGGASIIMSEDINYNSNQNIVNIRITDNSCNPFYLLTFLNTKYGYSQVERAATGNVQPWLNLSLLRRLKVFQLTSKFQNEIEKVILKAHEARQTSQNLYTTAEAELLAALGLSDYQPSTENVQVKSLKDSFLNSGRLDAEYYQPKYEEMVATIQTVNYARLGDVVSAKKSIEIGSDAYGEGSLPYIRVSDISKQGLTISNKYVDEKFYQSNKELIDSLKPKKDTILLSKDGSVGIAYKVNKDLDALTSGALLHLIVKNKNVILPDYLALVLNSKCVELQAERDSGGSIIKHWRPDQIKNVVVPILDLETQTKISNAIQRSFQLKTQSKHLLHLAKTGVEKAIESSEAEAMAWMEAEIGR